MSKTIIAFNDGVENKEIKSWFIQIGAVDFEILKVYILHPYMHRDITTYGRF